MTNKKFKLAAMSLALTACVAASPLAANAESAGTETEPPVTATSTDETKQEPTNETKQESTDESKQESTGESKQESTGESKQESTNESKQESTDESKQESANETKQESTNESKQESTDESKQESTNESKQESTNESKQESTDESKQEAADKNEQNPTDETKQNPTDETKQNPTNETKQNPTDETKQNPTDEVKQNPTDETKPEVAVENKVLAEAPAAKAPVLMTAALAKAPAAPTTPTEEDTVATITGQDGTTTQYKSFDEAVSKANDGDTIEVVKDTETAGMTIDKKLTIQGVTKTATKTNDDGTVEETTVKPKLTFKKQGIALWGTDLTFKDMQVEMEGVGSTPYTAEWNWMTISASKNATLTLDNTDMTMDGTGTADNTHAIYFGSNNKLNVQNGSNLTIKNYKQDALEWDGGDGGYNCNITGGSTFTSDNNRSGFTGTFYVTVDDSDVKVTNSTGNGSNGSYFTIKNGSNVLFDGNGTWGISAWRIDMSKDSTLTATNNGYSGIWTRVLNVDKTCTLDVESNGKKAFSDTTNPGIFFQGNGKFKSTIEEGADVTIKDNAGSGIYTKQKVCDLTIGSATITNNGSGAVNKSGLGAENGGGIYNIGTIKLGKGVTITGNTAKNGGGVYTKDGNVTINGGKVIGNTATNGNGGGIYAINGTVTATGSDISDNDAGQYNGGGICAQNSTLTLEKNTFYRNKSKSGGAIWMNASDAALTGNTIDHNAVTVSGGGIYAYGDTNRTSGNNTITLKDNTITYNTSKGTGGGIHLANANQIMTSLHDTIEYNEAASYGGGVHVASGSELLMNGGSISYNNAKVGGGIYHASFKKPITLNGVTVKGNTANSGAGAYLWASGATLVVGEDTLISENQAKYNGGGIYGGQRAIIDMPTGALYNNHAGSAGDDIYLKERSNTTLILRPVGDDWILDDCGHPIDGWYLDGKDARWDADSQKKFVTNLDAVLEGTDYEIEKGEDGSYIITISSNALALKAAHGVPPTPEPDPDGPDTPTPNPNPKPEPKPGPDTPITPEDPQLPPVQDARADTPDSPVLPANPTNPAVQDAHALPQTGTSLFAALAMALSGFALTIAGAWASLLGKNSRH